MVPRQLASVTADALRVYRLHTASRLFQSGDRLLKRDQRRDLRILAGIVRKLLFLALQPRAQQQIIHLAGLAERIEIDGVEQPELIGVKTVQLGLPERRSGPARRRGFTLRSSTS